MTDNNKRNKKIAEIKTKTEKTHYGTKEETLKEKDKNVLEKDKKESNRNRKLTNVDEIKRKQQVAERKKNQRDRENEEKKSESNHQSAERMRKKRKYGNEETIIKTKKEGSDANKKKRGNDKIIFGKHEGKATQYDVGFCANLDFVFPSWNNHNDNHCHQNLPASHTGEDPSCINLFSIS